MEKLVIIWLWWWWYTAAIYASRYWLNPVLIWESDGGMIVENPVVENFSGYPEPTSWYTIMENMRKQAEAFGTKIIQDRATSILPIDENDFTKWYIIKTNFNWEIQTKSLILATGTEKIHLNVHGEHEYFGKWVSYCATCDWFFYKQKVTAVIWWWDTAMIEALYLSDICQKVYLIHRRDTFRWESIWFERLKQKSNVEIITSTIVKEIIWENKVTWLNISTSEWVVYDENSSIDRKIDLDWVFIAVGTKPNPVEWIDKYLKRDNEWYMIVDAHQSTNLPWVFAAWDCTTWSGKFRQLIVACWEWAVAAEWVFKYINQN